MDGYHRKRTFYQDISGSFNILTATDDTTLLTGKANHTIYIQKVHWQVTTASAKTWQLVDSTGTAIQIAGPFATDTDSTHTDVDFGPEGVPLGEGKNLVLDVSATGAGGWVSWEGYMKRTTVTAA